MASGTYVVQISLTEQPQFRRLVEFLIDAETLARVTDDEDLLELVDGARADLLAMGQS